MKKLLLLSLLAFYTQINAQNVGIGNPTPAEKLDVTGNINVTGTIKANGVDGTANQVLMKNNSGLLTWGDACEYKNFKVYEFTTSGVLQTFTVPAGVNKIKVQMWGGGGKGLTLSSGNTTSGAGGGGGGYLEATLPVIPTTICNILIGDGATEANAYTGGGNTILSNLGTGVTIYAYGGENTDGIVSAMKAGLGGGYNFPATLTTAIGQNGEAGKITTINIQYLGTSAAGAISLGRETKYGNGGDAANTNNTGGQGRYLYVVGGSIYSDTSGGGKGKVPGGGGSATIITGKDEEDGANGRLIIYW